MSATNAEELELLDARLGSESPASYWLGLSSTTPSDDGSNITEPDDGNYSRVEVPNDAETFSAASTVGGVGTKVNAVTLALPTASGDWLEGADLTHWVLFDDAEAGAARYVGELDTPKPVLAGDTPSFAPGALKITLD